MSPREEGDDNLDLTAALEEAKQSARRARGRYFELFDRAPIGYIVTDRNSVVREANQAAAALLGRLPRHLSGKPLTAMVPLENRDEFRSEIARLASTPQTATWETTLVSTEGRKAVVVVTVTPSLAGARDAYELRWVLIDVTARDQAERATRRLAAELEERVVARTAELERGRALLEAVVENMPAGLVIVDNEGQVLTANDQARKILRLDDVGAFPLLRSEAYSMDGRRYEPGDFPLERTLTRGEAITNERMELVTPTGTHVVVDVSTAPILSGSGETLGALSLFQDVTLQERRERAEREFVTNAAHELQSPLAAIVSAIEVLQAGAKDGAERDVFLAHIEREADRLARLVRALLILARTQIGVEAPRDELVALAPMLEEVADGIRAMTSVEVVVECPEELGVLTNRELVEQAVVNLAENAAKNTSAGQIVLSAQMRSEGTVELGVSDTGSGIEASERGLVFERFYRADANGHPGFGLGLAIVRAVAEALDAEIELDSTVGRGTVVRLRFAAAVTMVTP